MKKLILKLLGIPWEEIRRYNDLKLQEDEIAEFKRAENKIKSVFVTFDEKTMNIILYCLRQYSDDGLPFKRYKELSDKYRFYDKEKYESVK
jgi:hypothetical protein